MRTGTVSYKLEDLKKGVIIPIGFVGENDFTRVIFDAEEIYKKYPSASVSMKVQPPKGVIYPAAVTRDGNTVIWQVKESDVANRGGGELQLTFIDGETKIKTYIAKTDVKRSLAGNGPAPDPVQDWVYNAEEVLDDLAAMDNIAKTAEAVDIGKALSPKTVENGVVTEWQYVEPGGGTEDYDDLDNKPAIGGVTLSGDKSLTDLGIASADSVSELSGDVADVKTAIEGISESVEAVNDFFETNDLDANAEGKVNVLNTPYDISDIATGKLISKNGSISDYDRSCVSPLIPISEGTYGLKVKKDASTNAGTINWGQDYKNGYGFFDSDGTTVISRPSTLLHSVGTDIYVFDVPSNAKYLRLSYYVPQNWQYSDVLPYFNQWILLPGADDNIDDTFFNLQGKKENGEIDKLERNDGSYLAIKDATARNALFGRRTCAIFEKVCGIGDSYMHGYIMNTSGTSHNEPDYSWVKHLESLTGREYLNLGITGARSDTWLTNPDGLAKMQLPANKAQAYIIGLQINDVAAQLTVGTVSDIGTETTSYYGCISKIIDEIFNVNDDAHVFLLTQPKTNEYIAPYRTAILNIVEWYQDANNGTHQNQVHLIDLLEYSDLFNYAGCNDSIVSHHYTAVGYEFIAEIMSYAWSAYINAHPLLFQDVNLIPYGSAT